MRCLAIVALTLFILGPAPLWASEATQEDTKDVTATDGKAPAETPAPEQEVGANKPEQKTGPAKGPSPDVFVPTDEISEDLSVSYPVDI